MSTRIDAPPVPADPLAPGPARRSVTRRRGGWGSAAGAPRSSSSTFGPTSRLPFGLPSRLADPMPADRRLGWLAPLGLAVLAGVLRFWRLGEPRAFVFDETYYAKDAFALLRYGTEQGFVEGANDRILRGDLAVFTGQPAFIAHPPFGKWVIAAGEAVFGVDPFGWRFAVALLGTLSVLMLARITRRLFRSTLLGCVAGLLLTFDALHFVHSRTALLDLILMVLVLGAFGCLLVDRDAARARLANGVGAACRAGPASRTGPVIARLRLRPWRLAAGVLLGLACGTKWSGVFFVAAFGLLAVAWDYGARKAAGVPRPARSTLLRDAPAAFAALVVVAAVVYVATWAGWLAGDGGWGRTWAATNPSSSPSFLPVPDAGRTLWHYHAEMWRFNKGLDDFHPYASNPWSWLLVGRTVSFHYVGLERGQGGCTVESCSEAVTAIGTPALWWAAILAICVTLAMWLGRRDWRAGAIAAGLLAGYLPWFAFQGRTIYFFYAIVFVPWLVLAVTYCLGLVLGPPGAGRVRRRWGAGLVGAYLLLVVANFAWLYPVLTAQVIPYADWAARMWLRSWI